MRQFTQNWLRTIQHYIRRTSAQAGDLNGDAAMEIGSIDREGMEIFENIYQRIEALESRLTVMGMERVLLWQISNNLGGVIAIEAYRLSITDQRPIPDKGRQYLYFVILPPGGENHRLWLFEEWLPSRNLFHDEQEGLLYSREK